MEFTQARIRLELGLLNMQLTKIAIVLLKMKRFMNVQAILKLNFIKSRLGERVV